MLVVKTNREFVRTKICFLADLKQLHNTVGNVILIVTLLAN